MDCLPCETPLTAQEVKTKIQQNNEEIKRLNAENIELTAQLEEAEQKAKEPVFEPKRRTVQWDKGCRKLSPQQYKVLDAFYVAPNQTLSLNELETAVWGEAAEVKFGTIKTAVSRASTVLADSGLPCWIESVLTAPGETMEVEDENAATQHHPGLNQRHKPPNPTLLASLNHDP